MKQKKFIHTCDCCGKKEESHCEYNIQGWETVRVKIYGESEYLFCNDCLNVMNFKTSVRRILVKIGVFKGE